MTKDPKSEATPDKDQNLANLKFLVHTQEQLMYTKIELERAERHFKIMREIAIENMLLIHPINPDEFQEDGDWVDQEFERRKNEKT